ncbi:MAG: hypothetical protein Q7R68_11075 [Nitrospirales bacterium]|nr:hypothetical protein [Nitrospirales bacterium]
MNYWVTMAVFSFAYIFLKAFQQLNVVHKEYIWVIPTSIGMGLLEVAMVLMIVRADTVWLGLATGVGGACGALLAMVIHKGVTRRRS